MQSSCEGDGACEAQHYSSISHQSTASVQHVAMNTSRQNLLRKYVACMTDNLRTFELLAKLLEKIVQILRELIPALEALQLYDVRMNNRPRKRRKTRLLQENPRVEWVHLQTVLQGVTFKRYYRLSKNTFQILLARIRPYLVKNEAMASLRGGVITPEIMLACTLRWLAGGSYLDIVLVHGISVTGFRACVKRVIVAINSEFPLCFPIHDLNRLGEIANGFRHLGHSGHV